MHREAKQTNPMGVWGKFRSKLWLLPPFLGSHAVVGLLGFDHGTEAACVSEGLTAISIQRAKWVDTERAAHLVPVALFC